MKKIILIFLILLTLLILINSNNIISIIINIVEIFKNKIFPSLFPFFLISELLVNYGFVDIISNLLKPIMEKVFKISKNCAFILIMSMISGFPSSAKYTKDLYLNNYITKEEATKILMFTHFSNPLFIIGSISLFLNNTNAAILILTTHYISNFIIGFIIRNIIKTPINNKNSKTIKSESFSKVFNKAILNSFSTLFIILGTMIFFIIITNSINYLFDLKPVIKGIINGILEMTGGISSISILNISLKLKTFLIGIFISFGGLSVHMQIKSILSDTDIKYLPYFLARIIHASITGILILLSFDYFI